MRSGLPSYCKCGAKLDYRETDVSEKPHDVYTGRPKKYRTKCKLECPYRYWIFGGHYKYEWVEERMKDPSVSSDDNSYPY